MIEALVRYFEEYGFEVYAFPGLLLIRKECAEQIIGWSWAIAQIDLQNQSHNDYLFDYADLIIAQLNEAIAAKE